MRLGVWNCVDENRATSRVNARETPTKRGRMEIWIDTKYIICGIQFHRNHGRTVLHACSRPSANYLHVDITNTHATTVACECVRARFSMKIVWVCVDLIAMNWLCFHCGCVGVCLCVKFCDSAQYNTFHLCGRVRTHIWIERKKVHSVRTFRTDTETHLSCPQIEVLFLFVLVY